MGVSWRSMELSLSSMELHGIPMELPGGPRRSHRAPGSSHVTRGSGTHEWAVWRWGEGGGDGAWGDGERWGSVGSREH